MFTGIIEEVGMVVECVKGGDITHLEIRGSTTAVDLVVGGSVAVNGCCLTATSVQGDLMTFDLAPETLRRTSFHERLRPGVRVNLERPLRLAARLDGHFVQGHVDGLATVANVRPSGEATEIAFDVPADLARYCVEKGSVAIDGVSLTCATVVGNRIVVALIPHTLEVTTLGALRVGDPVSLEVDMIAKYVEKLVTK